MKLTYPDRAFLDGAIQSYKDEWSFSDPILDKVQERLNIQEDDNFIFTEYEKELLIDSIIKGLFEEFNIDGLELKGLIELLQKLGYKGEFSF